MSVLVDIDGNVVIFDIVIDNAEQRINRFFNIKGCFHGRRFDKFSKIKGENENGKNVL